MGVKGKIANWNDNKGYGFITPQGGGNRIFFHISSLKNRNKRPVTSQWVSYKESSDKHGRPCAIDVTYVGSASRQGVALKLNSPSLLLAILFLVFTGMSVFLFDVTPLIFVLYVIMSLVTFFLYARDKYAALNGAWRTPENTLHLFSLLGGWPGAAFAQQSLRHKSAKQSFRFVFRLTVILNVGAFIWILTSTGSSEFHSLIDEILSSIRSRF
jgi:uncharacterized membrane protein YsdA (DUF1294 family)/cold shock CspA family protein